jgi:hypothetical protein
MYTNIEEGWREGNIKYASSECPRQKNHNKNLKDRAMKENKEE